MLRSFVAVTKLLISFKGGFGFSGGLGSSQPSSFGFSSGFNQAQPFQAPQQQTQPQPVIQQQIEALTHYPYGDNPLFKGVLGDAKKAEEVLKPTNPAAQKALTSSIQYKVTETFNANNPSTPAFLLRLNEMKRLPLEFRLFWSKNIKCLYKLRHFQFQVSPLRNVKVKPKPLTPSGQQRSAIFDGLNEDDETNLSRGEIFVPRKSIKKLNINPKSPSTFDNPNENSSALLNLSQNDSSTSRGNNPNQVHYQLVQTFLLYKRVNFCIAVVE